MPISLNANLITIPTGLDGLSTEPNPTAAATHALPMTDTFERGPVQPTLRQPAPSTKPKRDRHAKKPARQPTDSEVVEAKATGDGAATGQDVGEARNRQPPKPQSYQLTDAEKAEVKRRAAALTSADALYGRTGEGHYNTGGNGADVAPGGG